MVGCAACVKVGPSCLGLCVCVYVCAQSTISVSVFDHSRWMGCACSVSPSALLSVGLHSTVTHQVLTQTLTRRSQEDELNLIHTKGRDTLDQNSAD